VPKAGHPPRVSCAQKDSLGRLDVTGKQFGKKRRTIGGAVIHLLHPSGPPKGVREEERDLNKSGVSAGPGIASSREKIYVPEDQGLKKKGDSRGSASGDRERDVVIS